MMYLLAVVLIFLALLAGLLVNRRWLGTAAGAADEDWLALNDLVVPVTTLAVVLLAFVMVEALASYDRARTLVAEEAQAVDQLAQEAPVLASRADALALRQELLCYVRAVRFQEWPAMAHGASAPAVDAWAAALRTRVTALSTGGEEVEWVSRLLDRLGELGHTRRARLTEANPTIPAGLSWLMFGCVILAVLGLAVLVRPHGRRQLSLAVLVVFAVVTAATLWMIGDLDSPFSGVNKLAPTALARVQPSLEQAVGGAAPAVAPPCDAHGAATAAPS